MRQFSTAKTGYFANGAAMEPDKHVEIKPQMARYNSADNTGLDCSDPPKPVKFIFRSISCISVYPIHDEVTIVGATRGDEINLTTKSFPIRIGQ